MSERIKYVDDSEALIENEHGLAIVRIRRTGPSKLTIDFSRADHGKYHSCVSGLVGLVVESFRNNGPAPPRSSPSRSTEC